MHACPPISWLHWRCLRDDKSAETAPGRRGHDGAGARRSAMEIHSCGRSRAEQISLMAICPFVLGRCDHSSAGRPASPLWSVSARGMGTRSHRCRPAPQSALTARLIARTPFVFVCVCNRAASLPMALLPRRRPMPCLASDALHLKVAYVGGVDIFRLNLQHIQRLSAKETTSLIQQSGHRFPRPREARFFH